MQLKILFFSIVLYIIGEKFTEAAISRKSLKHGKTPVTLYDVLRYALEPERFGGSFVPGSDDTIRVVFGNSIWEYNLATNTNSTVVESSIFEDRFGPQYLGLTLSTDNQYILVEHSRKSLWRHSYLAKYDIYNIAQQSFTIVEPNGLGNENQLDLQLVQWAPTGNSLTFIYENNIFYKKSPNDISQQITADGNDEIFNGISDWVYEEEMFGTPVAMWFSKDSSHLAFVKFDDASVPEYSWPLYGEPGVRETVYPIYDPIRYPKAGRDNPNVTLNVVNLNDPTTYSPVVYPANQDKNLQYYIATVTWASETQLIVQTLNRHQNQSVWNYCKDAICTEIYTHSQNSPEGWIDRDSPIVSQDASKFLTLQPVKSSNGLTYIHVVLVSTSNATPNGFTPLTSGPLHIDSILGWDEQSNKIYFSGTGLHPNVSNVSDPREKQVYSIDSTPGGNASPVCLSCSIKTGNNEECLSHIHTYSAKFQFYTHACLGPGVPVVSTKRTETNEVVKVWNDNSELKERLAGKLLPKIKDLEVDVSGGFKAKVRLYLPPDFNENAKYPLLIDVYAGPGSQKITHDYKIDWGTYLTSSQGVIYGLIDGHGSGRQSLELKYSIYRNIGTVEVEDQINVTKHLVNTLKYIDANKTAIWGWSYGGYVTAKVMGIDTGNVFKCGIAVAPVTSWLYYDTIYTERYMGLPTDEDNWANYNSGSVMNHVENFKTKQFLLIHGNADDNVHYQQSMMLARALEEADVIFSQLSYPDENHGINGVGMRRHLYHSIEHFLTRDCFGDLTKNSGSSFWPNFPFTFAVTVIFMFCKILV